MSNEIADTIGKMREILIERGRTTSVFENTSGQVCLLGALCLADGVPTREDQNNDNYSYVADHPVTLFLAELLGGRNDGAVIGYNDGWSAPSPTDAAVLDFLYEAQLAAKEL